MANPVATLWRIPELRSKMLFTLLCLVMYRIGAHITAPWIDVAALREYAGTLQGTAFGIYDMFVGGGLSRATVFALGIMPYISASIMFQLAAAVVPSVEKMQKEGEDGRKKLTQWTRYTTVLLAIFQAYGFAMFIETQVPGAVQNPGLAFRLMMILTLTTGAVFIMWLGEQITERGIGNGMSLLIFFGIIEGLPAALYETGRLVALGQVNPVALVVLAAALAIIIAGTVAVTMAARKIPVQIPQKVMGRGRIRQGQKSFIPLRINMAGVMPIIFAQSIMIVPATLGQFSDAGVAGPAGRDVRGEQLAVLRGVLGADRVLHVLLHGDHLQPGGHRREPEEAGRLRAGDQARRAHGRVHRPGDEPHLASRRALPGRHRADPLGDAERRRAWAG